MKNNINKSLLAILLFLSSVMVSGQQPPDPLGNTGAPIDDGSFLLITIGIIYGASKYYQTRKKNKNIIPKT